MLQPQTPTGLTAKLLRSGWLIQGAILLLLVIMPLVAERPLLNMLTLIFCMGVFAMSYDILLGYTGIVSFGHALFFGIGAYSVAIIITHTQTTLGNLVLAVLLALLVNMIISLFVGFLSLRVKDTYYAMITLAIAELGFIIAEKARHITNGYDGITFRVPGIFMDRTVFYYIALLFLVLSFIILWKFTHSPAGRVLVAIRENEQRVKFLGYNVLHYKLISTVIAGAFAGLAGSFYVIHMRFVSTSAASVFKTIEALLATIIGGVGTLYGAIVGSAVVSFAGDYLSKLAKVHPLFERWYILFGLLYIVIVLFAPYGVMGAVYKYLAKKEPARLARQATKTESR